MYLDVYAQFFLRFGGFGGEALQQKCQIDDYGKEFCDFLSPYCAIERGGIELVELRGVLQFVVFKGCK